MRKIAINEEEYNKIVAAEKATQDKQISRKLKVLMLRHENLSNTEIAKRLGFCSVRVSQIVSEYKKQGLDVFMQKKYGGHHRNMSETEETELLETFKKQAESGQMVIAREIKAAFDKRLGRDTGRGYIYMLLARHGWRKVMPRSRHPKKADQEAINASKKLRAQQRRYVYSIQRNVSDSCSRTKPDSDASTSQSTAGAPRASARKYPAITYGNTAMHMER